MSSVSTVVGPEGLVSASVHQKQRSGGKANVFSFNLKGFINKSEAKGVRSLRNDLSALSNSAARQDLGLASKLIPQNLICSQNPFNQTPTGVIQQNGQTAA